MMIVPAINEIVEVKSACDTFSDSYDIVGYEKTIDGFLQSFSSKHLRPLDHQFAEDVIAHITELETNSRTEQLVNARNLALVNKFINDGEPTIAMFTNPNNEVFNLKLTK